MRSYKPKKKGGTEYEGKMGPAGVHPKNVDALSAGDRLRLIYRTGQENDTTVKATTRSMQGLAERGKSVVDKKPPDEKAP